MKSPLLNSFERKVIRETKSFYRDRLLLYLAKERFKRDLYYSIFKIKLEPIDVYLASTYPYTLTDMHQLLIDCKNIKGSYPTRSECKKVVEMARGNNISFLSAAIQYYSSKY